MSTLYGSDAMGGVINIITRKVAKTWGGEVERDPRAYLQDNDWGAVEQGQLLPEWPHQAGPAWAWPCAAADRRDASDCVGAGRCAAQPMHATRHPRKAAQHNIGARLTTHPQPSSTICGWTWMQGRTWYNNDDGRLGWRDADNTRANTRATRVALRFNRDQVAWATPAAWALARL